MARVTIEDCIGKKIVNRFELVVLTAHRAREIASGAKLHVERRNDKDGVVALREVAGEFIEPAALKESLINKFSTMSAAEKEDLPENEDDLEIQQSMTNFVFQPNDMKDMSYEDEEMDSK